jgi:hypothetical protein
MQYPWTAQSARTSRCALFVFWNRAPRWRARIITNLTRDVCIIACCQIECGTLTNREKETREQGGMPYPHNWDPECLYFPGGCASLLSLDGACAEPPNGQNSSRATRADAYRDHRGLVLRLRLRSLCIPGLGQTRRFRGASALPAKYTLRCFAPWHRHLSGAPDLAPHRR